MFWFAAAPGVEAHNTEHVEDVFTSQIEMVDQDDDVPMIHSDRNLRELLAFHKLSVEHHCSEGPILSDMERCKVIKALESYYNKQYRHLAMLENDCHVLNEEKNSMVYSHYFNLTNEESNKKFLARNSSFRSDTSGVSVSSIDLEPSQESTDSSGTILLMFSRVVNFILSMIQVHDLMMVR